MANSGGHNLVDSDYNANRAGPQKKKHSMDEFGQGFVMGSG